MISDLAVAVDLAVYSIIIIFSSLSWPLGPFSFQVAMSFFC